MMKTKPLYLILIALLSAMWLFSGCTQNKETEEAGLFLQNMEIKLKEIHPLEIRNTTFPGYYHDAIEAERTLPFILEQRIRLKKIQLRVCAKEPIIINKHLKELSELGLETRNDSIILNTYKYIFARQCHQTESQEIEHTLNKILEYRHRTNDPLEMETYYLNYGLVLIRNNRIKESLSWIQKGRSQKLFNLYHNTMGKALVELGRHEEAILHIDSVWTRMPAIQQINADAGYVKGKALEATGNISEALKWYESVVQKIDSVELSNNKPSKYSPNQIKMLLNYATLLSSQNKSDEALSILNRPIKSPESLETYLTQNMNSGPYMIYLKWYQTIAECYRKLNDQEKAKRYEFMADSIQKNASLISYQIAQRLLKESRDNLNLEHRLNIQTREATLARYNRYLLGGIVSGLLLIIAGGIFWWRERQKRIFRLFQEITVRQTRWEELHYLLSGQEYRGHDIQPAGLPQFLSADISEAKQADHVPKTNYQQQNYQRIYFRLLQVMDKEKPFLDPELDLVGLSRLVGTNRSLLSATLNQQTKMNFSYWLAEYRVNFLIRQTDLYPEKKMDDLASICGFSSRTSFYRQFKLITGLTPKQFMDQKTR
ncbi:MAG: helix-turn-helix domain-containing protein [Bacteroidales bacterium]